MKRSNLNFHTYITHLLIKQLIVRFCFFGHVTYTHTTRKMKLPLCLLAAVVNGGFWGRKEKIKLEKLVKLDECERRTRNGDQLFVHFWGMKEIGGDVFQTSMVGHKFKHEKLADYNKPYRFQLGLGEVIQGTTVATEGRKTRDQAGTRAWSACALAKSGVYSFRPRWHMGPRVVGRRRQGSTLHLNSTLL